MPTEFYKRLRQYYLDVAKVLRGEAAAAAVFPNASDIGTSRETIYASFLEQHVPSKCNVFLGGFLFHRDGSESKQLDVIVTTDTAPRFELNNRSTKGKSFSPVEGTIGVASIKSTLDKDKLFDALGNIASIPPTEGLDGRIPLTVRLDNYSDWPYKIVYANNGIKGETALRHTYDYYRNREIPVSRRPNLIHVAGAYVILRIVDGMKAVSVTTGKTEMLPVGAFKLFTRDPDLQAIVWVLNGLQQNAFWSKEILFKYDYILNNVVQS